MKQFLITVAGVLAGLILFLVIAPIVLVASIAGGHKESAAPGAIVLQLDLRNPISDQRQANGLAFLSPQLSTVDIIRKLDAAAADGRVKGVYVRGATSGLDPAQAEEIRTALNGVRDAKKFVYAHLQNDGTEMSLPSYEAIAGASQIWLQESGDFMPMGLLSQRMYLGGALQK
ncbi:MAG TPA: signal peptide peptidase SppA, partial [Caulobacterales bacterium]|nr:signal peptide peptidase SppA [Caulobacterales bacterium]